MMIDKENNIITINEDGKDVDYTILLTFDTDDDKTYYVYTKDELDEDGFVKTYAGIYDNTNDEEKLLPIESDEEWELIEILIDNLDRES